MKTTLTILSILCTTVLLAQVGNNASVLNPNRATEAELAEIPGLSEEMVAKIIKGKPYLNITQLHTLLAGSMDEASTATVLKTLFLPINLNSATEEEIYMVPGVGKKMAHEFEEYRPYKSLAQFRREIGKYVNDEELARLEQYVFVPIGLNNASEQDILSIPGVGERMLHEFLEYRPYKSMEQFKREIGKYVDDDELERLARYVYVD